MLFSRIDISHILSFHFISFKRTSTTMFSSILFSTHLVFFSSLSTSSWSLSLVKLCFLLSSPSLFAPNRKACSERERERDTSVYAHACYYCSAMLFKSAMSLFWPRRLLARLGFDVVDDNGRHRQFDCFQFCSQCAGAVDVFLFLLFAAPFHCKILQIVIVIQKPCLLFALFVRLFIIFFVLHFTVGSMLCCCIQRSTISLLRSSFFSHPFSIAYVFHYVCCPMVKSHHRTQEILEFSSLDLVKILIRHIFC